MNWHNFSITDVLVDWGENSACCLPLFYFITGSDFVTNFWFKSSCLLRKGVPLSVGVCVFLIFYTECHLKNMGCIFRLKSKITWFLIPQKSPFKTLSRVGENFCPCCSMLFVLLLITTASLTHTCVHAVPQQSHTACSHTCALGDPLTDSLSLTQHHMHVTTMIFHSVHYCNLNNSYVTAYH